ncbi:alpha/beta fold hydrolase [Rhodococcus opacus]|uniref:Alpha/beta fold hydrolase n=1 Tax=Rhodococcus opacus TaxID=37919 RepID=A0AAX3YJW0_RHOOP|nr:alpha/beta fold hydrolase [Rhodococcus opacus]MCZ4585313.1 alpha/beta fold hydrolase [Rhodococcus opacus]WKN57597.1 alpha/beta fold hydrolase [Rhodococcus opacus]WLF49045.1 alpha/beta fold hydrolase [Rhodococcus opacus]
MITVLCCRGIGEDRGVNMLTNTTQLLDPARFVVKQVPWEASYGPVPDPGGSAFDKALSEGRTLLLRMIAEDPSPVVLLGYSGGAALAGNVAAEVGRGQHPSLDVRGAGLIADPLRPASPDLPGWGIAGQRLITGMPVWQIADPLDVICCCPDNSPLRTFADQSAAFSLADPRAWVSDLVDRLRTRRWQAVILNWWRPWTVWQQYSEAIDDVNGYLFRGDHTSYRVRLAPGTDRTYCALLADRVGSLSD